MRLERLEISGFKSFPDRADLHFDRGVTAIVGPNGCGKSNVVDAITWVLGEQSAKSLRGERMEDVIFGGSDARKATAAAEVKLRLGGVTTRPKDGVNGDGGVDLEALAEQEPPPPPMSREVELSRRLYRSGESEYLIDGHSCRLKDIQDLLMDVGLGVKGYAVIEQGKIGQILSAKPTDRRQLIEEAAGVTKYKARRRAAELKLEAAQQNLTRIDDIIFELEKQRGTLKRQAAKARRYRLLREELRRWEKLSFAQKYDVLAEAIKSARERLAQAREREAIAAARVGEIEADVERLRIELTEADTRANTLRAEAHARELANEKRQQQITFDTQQADSLATRISEIAGELASLEARRAPGLEELESRRDFARRADEERDRAAQAQRAEEDAHADVQREIRDLEHHVETARSALFANLNATTTLQHAIERAEEARTRIAEGLSRLDVEASDLKIEIDRRTLERERAAEELRTVQAALEETQALRVAADLELGTAGVEREWRVKDARNLEREVASIAARLKSLEELDAARAGYGDAARLILASHDANIAHRGSVADYLEVDREFERTVETSFGDLLQYVIVDRAEDAERGLAFVRDHKAGKCGFLVAQAAESLADAPSSVPGDSRALIAHLRVTGPYAALIRRALGDVLIAETFAEAVELSARTPVPVATRAGDVFRHGLLILGGGRDDARGILVTKREIKELREKLAEDQITLQRLTEEISTLEASIATAQQTIAALEGERHRNEKGLLQNELQVARAAEELQRLERRQELAANERRRFDEERQQADRRQEEARTSIARLAEEHEIHQGRMNEAQAQLADGRERLTQAAQRAAEAKAASATLIERASGVAQEVRRLEEAARELDSRIETRTDERTRMEQHRTDLLDGTRTSQEQLDRDFQSFTELRQEVLSFEDRVSELQTTFQTHESQARDARHALDAVRTEANQYEVARATAESDLSHLASTCQETLQLTLDEVAAEVAAQREQGQIPESILATAESDDDSAEASDSEELPDTDVAAVQAASSDALAAAMVAEGEDAAEPAARAASPVVAAKPRRALSTEEAIALLKKKIDRLGPVNMMAIEQFDELETRHSFLTTQRKDLLDSIAATGEAIKRIDTTTKERFREAFATINGYFGEMFNTLFGGGRAGLVLLNEEDALESGIDIIAQPPGKRLQNVQLLSGGEKALTAMALMFGIFRYRPSPFCLLDEIDAPLDDANIGRFVEMLRGMLDHTQFILITHHRKTMEIADRLYGVTMEEPGVSKLISLKLN